MAMRILSLLFQADNNLTPFLLCLDLEYTMGNHIFIFIFLTVIKLEQRCYLNNQQPQIALLKGQQCGLSTG